MTTELEQEFFKVFGIEPDCAYLFLIDGKGENKAARTLSFGSKADLKRFVCECGGKGKVIKAIGSPHIYYPEITDRKLLEMICIMNKHIHKHNENALCPIAGESRKEIKNYMLRLLNFNQPLLEKIFIKEIQQLFKEEE